MGRRALTVVVCWLAPLALFLPWFAQPALLPGGWAFGGAAFFSHWLTKYPNLGPINVEVALGIACIVGCALLPMSFALYVTRTATPRPRVLVVLTALLLVCYVPVLVQLDGMLWWVLVREHLPDGFGALLRFAALANAALVTGFVSRSSSRPNSADKTSHAP